MIIPGELSFKVSLIESVDTLYLPDLRFFLFTKISFAYPVLKFNLFFVLNKISFFYLKFSLFSFFHRYLLSCAHMKFNLLFPFTKISLVYPVLIWTDPGVETFCVGDRWEEVDKGDIWWYVMIYGDMYDENKWTKVDKFFSSWDIQWYMMPCSLYDEKKWTKVNKFFNHCWHMVIRVFQKNTFFKNYLAEPANHQPWG